MFTLTQTFIHSTGLTITPIEMEGIGFIFLPKELEKELGYYDLSKNILHSDSFVEGIEYIILRNPNLELFKELLNRGNSITSVKDKAIKHSSALLLFTVQTINHTPV